MFEIARLTKFYLLSMGFMSGEFADQFHVSSQPCYFSGTNDYSDNWSAGNP